MVTPAGLEPAASALKGQRLNQFDYGAIWSVLAELNRLSRVLQALTRPTSIERMETSAGLEPAPWD